MKHTLLFAALATTLCANAQFTSGFENWPDTVPGDWMGSRTTLSADSVEQVSTNVHGGTYAVRVINGPSAHKRFTTQPVTVVDGTTYDVSFWVRGAGSVRVGLYDGRTAGSGYATYNQYFVSTGNTWTQVTQQITAANDTTAAEFILSVQLTSGPEHLVIDDVNITTGIINPPVDASIYEIQYTTAVDGNSPLMNQVVNTGGIVTGVDTAGANSWFVQAGTGPWSGIYVFDNTSVVALGDSVTFTATVAEFNGTTELTAVTNLVVVGTYPEPAPQVLDPVAAADEQWEGVLSHINGLQCMNLPDIATFFEWTGTSWQGSMSVDDLMYLYAPTVGNYYDVTGVMHWANGARKIEPRQLSDITAGSGIAAASSFGVEIFPNPTADVLNIVLPSGNATYSMVDATGRTVLNGNLNSLRSTVEVASLTPGAYSLVLNTGTAIGTVRVVVQR